MAKMLNTPVNLWELDRKLNIFPIDFSFMGQLKFAWASKVLKATVPANQ